jgi:hypothetical protein
MSYEIVKSIVIKDGNKVFIRADSNNVYPKNFKEQYSESLTALLKEKGQEEFDLIILREYESGNFQSPASIKNKWTTALKNIYYVFQDEYNLFNWRSFKFEERDKEKQMRESPEFKALLLKALNTPLPKEKFIVVKDGCYYARKETSRHLFYTSDKAQAKQYDFKIQAEQTAKRFGLNNFEVLTI